ncbi:hypothetical protein BJX65DRAFT_276901 [Aspergillus insuetus]
MEFSRSNGNPLIDEIINKCWHNQYVTVSDLAAHTKKLLDESTDTAGDSGLGGGIQELRSHIGPFSMIVRWRMAIGHIVHGLWYDLGTFVLRSTDGVIAMGRAIDDSSDKLDQHLLEGSFASKKAFCQDLEKWGLLRALASGESEEIGFTFD